MFDFSIGELLLLGVVALVVLGPEKLPHTMRMLGAWMGRIRRTVINIQAEIEQEVQAQEMRKRIEKEMSKVRDSELAQGLKKEMADLDASLRQAQEATPQPIPVPENKILPPAVEPPGEKAFMAHLQSSHALAVAKNDTLATEHKPVS